MSHMRAEHPFPASEPPLPREEQAAYSPARILQEYLGFFSQLVSSLDIDAICGVVDRLRLARDTGATVYIAGNGGSAATAAHFANDLGKAAKQSGRAPFRVMTLTDNTSWLTALANDEGYERVFTGQLENFAAAGDVLIVISASGSSANLVDAVDFARENGMVTIGLLGFDGGHLKDRLDELLWVETPQGAYGPVETAHVLLCDLLSTCLMKDRP
jgi:D-sedoheptulose 7-phosphate isomerase